MAAYADVGDLVIGEVLLPQWVVKQDWIDKAAEEIDSRLGFLYTIPLTAAGGGGWAAVAPHEKLLVKTINYKLASGRLILALDAGSEDRALHAYGLSLVREANNDLMCIANGQVHLDTVAINSTTASNGPSRTPGVANLDGESLVEAWTSTVIRGEPKRAYTGLVPPLPIWPNPELYPTGPA